MDKQMITVRSGFQYSANIRYDVNNSQKIQTYIPTDSFVGLINDIVTSFEPHSADRSRIIIGPYGTGKSHLITVIASMLKKSIDIKGYEPLFEKLHLAGYTDLPLKLKDLISQKPFLTVILNTNNTDLEQVFIRGLQTALSEEGIEDLMPRTVFNSVLETLVVWEEHYPETFENLESILESKYSLSYAAFLTKVKDYDQVAVKIFQEIFPLLSSGAQFNLYNAKDIPELYREVAIELHKKGYRGIYIIFDEFNKVLESSLNGEVPTDLKLLQDLAEMCNRSASHQVHLMLVTHQHMTQYATRLPEDVLNTWRKVEGRFTPVNIWQSDSKTYQLISAVIEKEPDLWKLHQSEHQIRFNQVLEKTQKQNLFSELDDALKTKNWVVDGCYPLHPATVFALPRVSNRLAQNERTLFTFLATKDLYTLGSFLDEGDQQDFQLLTIDVLFDYFCDLARRRRNHDSLGQSFLRADESLAKLSQNPNKMAMKILKSLAITIGLEEPNFIPTANTLEFCLVSDSEDKKLFDDALNMLIEKKIVYERKSDGLIQFLSGSDVDFREEIEGVRGDYRHAGLFHTSEILNNYFAPYPIIANRYNDEFEMTRFFYQEFFLAKELLQITDWSIYLRDKNYADGIVAYILCETEEQSHLVDDYLKSINCSQMIFIKSNKPMQNFSEIVFDFMALNLLKKDKNFLEKDPHILVELDAYLSDYEEQIERRLSAFVSYRSNDSDVYHKGQKRRAIQSRADLSKLVSDACATVFDQTPTINNELINRANVSRTVINARKKVVDGLLKGIAEPQLGLKGYGPDVSIFRSMLKRPGFYREETLDVVFDDTVDKRFIAVVKLIQDSLLNAGNDPVSFSEITEKLRKPPYGLRTGVIPVLFALAFCNVKKRLLIRDIMEIEQPLDADLIEAITKNPKLFTGQIISMDQMKQNYLEDLAQLFEQFMPDNHEMLNHAYPIGMSMKTWFINLPKYTRESKNHSRPARTLRRYLNMPVMDSTELVFNQIPNLVTGQEGFNSDDIDIYVTTIKEVKNELETHFIFVSAQLEESVKRFFGAPGVHQTLEQALSEWYGNLAPKTKSYAFSGTAYKVLELAKSTVNGSVDSVLDGLITILVGLNLNDWSDETSLKFELELKNTIDSIESIEKEEVFGTHQKVSFLDGDGELNERIYEKVELSPLGEILLANLESALDGFADAINMEEKRQVLLDLLKSIS